MSAGQVVIGARGAIREAPDVVPVRSSPFAASPATTARALFLIWLSSPKAMFRPNLTALNMLYIGCHWKITLGYITHLAEIIQSLSGLRKRRGI